MDGVTSLHVVVGDVLLVSKRLATVDETDHGHIDTLFLLQSLFNLQHCVRGLEVKGLLHSR